METSRKLTEMAEEICMWKENVQSDREDRKKAQKALTIRACF